MGDSLQEPRTHHHVWVFILAVVFYPLFAWCGMRYGGAQTYSEIRVYSGILLPAMYIGFFLVLAWVGLRLKWVHLVWFTLLMLAWVATLHYVLYEAFKSA